jgi:uncharacterized protein involved in exopolysaccharide biosynthesis
MRSTPPAARPEPVPPTAETAFEPPGLLDYVHGVVRRARWILAAAVAAGLVTAVVSLLMPAWYAARATFLPSTEERTTPSLTAMLQGALNPGGGLSQLMQAGDLSVSLMQSMRIREPLVREFDLVERYRARDVDEAAGALDRHTSFHVGQEGMVRVTVEDRDPEVAAALANRTVELLDRFNAEQRMTRGRRTRQFVEAQLETTQAALARAEEALTAYQESTRVVPLSSSDASAVETGAMLLTRKMQLEIELEVKGEWLAEESEELRRLRTELDEVERRLGELPALQLEFARLVRDVKVQEEVYRFLRSQLEEARIREQEDTPSLTVVDRATPPALRARPQRTKMVLAAVVLAGLVAVLGALATTYAELLPAGSRRRQALAATGRELRDLVLWRRR